MALWRHARRALSRDRQVGKSGLPSNRLYYSSPGWIPADGLPGAGCSGAQAIITFNSPLAALFT
jgi:hypothetical protein